MISGFEFYHGAVLARLVHRSNKVFSIKPFPSEDNASYVVNEKIGIYIKYSTKRMSPWHFSFYKRHQDEIIRMKNKIGDVYILLVCKDDGIVTLNFEEFKKIFNDDHEAVEWVSASRFKRQMYTIKGSDGALEFKIGQNDFPAKIFNKPKRDLHTSIFSWSH